MMTLGEAFSIRFDGLLKEKNITLHKFVKDSCIARSTIVNIKKGNTKCPTLAIVYQVAYGFNMTPVEFLSNEVFYRDELEYI